MGKGVLDISSTLKLPLDYVTQTGAILARRGAGKTYTALKLAEEFAENGLPFVAIDPTGVMWGLRSSATGGSGGWPIVILGGEHGDIPLDSTSGKVIAEFVVDSGMSVILDLSLFESKAQSNRFLYDFADRLFRYKAKHREPLHLLLDEADQFCPQQPKPDDMKMLGAWESIVRLGRSRGLGMTMITQRAAVLNKNVLTQIEVLFAFQNTSPQDRKAILDWVNATASKEEAKEMLDSLASLQPGEGWVWSPGWLRVLVRVQISKRKTFDSSRTPEAGEVLQPKQVAPVDLEALAERMQSTIERALATDPSILQARVRELERELKAMANQPAEVRVETRVVRVEVPPAGIEKRLLDLSQNLAMFEDELQGVYEDLRCARIEEEAKAEVAEIQGSPPPDWAAKKVQRRSVPVAAPAGDVKLGKAERMILAVLWDHGHLTKGQLGIRTGYQAKGGGFGNALSALRTAGYVEGSGDIAITDAGMAAAQAMDLPYMPSDLFDFWKNKAHGKAEKLILEELRRAGDWVTREDLAAATGYEAKGGGFGNALSKVKTMDLVEKDAGSFRLATDFREAIS